MVKMGREPLTFGPARALVNTRPVGRPQPDSPTRTSGSRLLGTSLGPALPADVFSGETTGADGQRDRTGGEQDGKVPGVEALHERISVVVQGRHAQRGV